MKILSIITPIITLLFSLHVAPKTLTLICKLDTVYRYIIYNGKTVYGHFTHILHKGKWYIKSFCYNIVENYLYTKFGIKKILKPKNVLVIKKSIVFAYACSFMSFYLFVCLFF